MPSRSEILVVLERGLAVADQGLGDEPHALHDLVVRHMHLDVMKAGRGIVGLPGRDERRQPATRKTRLP